MIRAARLALAGLVILAACSSSNSVEKPQGVVLANLIKQQIGKAASPKVQPVNTALILTRGQLAGITEPLIRIRSETTKDTSLLYVAQRNAGSEIWKSADNASFTMRRGVIVQTRGLGHDLYASDASGLISALQRGGASQGLTRINRRMEGTNQVVSDSYACDLVDLGGESLVVLGLSFATRHYRETCQGAGETYANDYWVDSRGVVRASRQRIGPEFGHVYLERLID